LLNKLAQDEVAIVTDVPGTTRDVLRRQVHLDGLPVNLIDTAGLRRAVDVVEAEGVRRAHGEIAKADRVLYVLDAAGPPDAEELAQLPREVPVTLVFNKIDLSGTAPRFEAGDAAATPRVYLSALNGAGLDLLRTHLKESAGYQDSESGAFSARRRHLDALRRARGHVQDAAEILSSTRAFELFAEDLRLAQQALGEITGEFTSEDLLGEIFSSFCIGK
jgi:tRNA modification GTPase